MARSIAVWVGAANTTEESEASKLTASTIEELEASKQTASTTEEPESSKRIANTNEESEASIKTVAPKNSAPKDASHEILNSSLNSDPLDAISLPEIELHFNLWTLNSKKQNRKNKREDNGRWLFPLSLISSAYNFLKRGTKRCVLFMKEVEPICFLDVGVKFKQIGTGDIFVYFPFHITQEDYDGELGSLISNDVKLISAIFNDEVENIQYEDNHYHFSKIKFAGASKPAIRFFTRLDLSETNALGPGVQLKPVGQDGCFLRFPSRMFNLAPDEYGYFRFRIILNGACQKAICTSYKPKDRFFITSEEHIDMIDFRVNEIRNLPENINKHVSDNFLLKKVHFLVIREIDSEYVMAHTSYDRCRLLEGNVWRKYLKTNKLHSIQEIPKMLVFHWKSAGEKMPHNPSNNKCDDTKSRSIGEFTAFAKFAYRRQSMVIIIRSILVALFFSILANFMSAPIEKLFTIRQDTSTGTGTPSDTSRASANDETTGKK